MSHNSVPTREYGDYLPKGLDREEISDERILQIMSHIPREDFVPEPLKTKAYEDTPLPIGNDQTISQPFIVAFMTQEAEISAGENVLEIGTGSGYQAAVLDRLGATVFSIEIVPELAKEAREKLQRLGYKNVQVKEGDGFEGWEEHAPYDAIIVTAATSQVPEKLREQLGVGGKMVLPLRDKQGVEWLTVIKKDKEGELRYEREFRVRFVPMTGKVQEIERRGQ